MIVTTELERRLLGAIGGFMGLTSHVPDIAKSVFQAAEIPEGDVDAALRGPSVREHFNCTMWNLCNEAVGKPMLTHEEIRKIRKGGGQNV